jgi:uncharacterized membrane protein YfcA
MPRRANAPRAFLPSRSSESSPRGAGREQPAGRYWSSLALIGVVGGVLSGLFAIGGGILMVPLLVARAHLDQRRASATSLAAIIPAAAVGSATYLVNGEVDVAAAAFIALGAAGGAVLGSAWLARIPLVALRWMFIFFILAVAARLLFVVPQRGHDLALSPAVALGYVALGLVMGIASGLFGIGGGIIAVPLLISFFAVSDLVAKGTSLLVSIPTSLVGTVSNRRAGLVDLRVALVVGTAAAVAAVPAAGVALLMPARLSAVLFSALLIAVATQLTVKTLRAGRSSGPSPGSPAPTTEAGR